MENKKSSLLTRIILGSAVVLTFSGCNEVYHTSPRYHNDSQYHNNDWDRRYWFNYNRSRLWKEPINKSPYFKPRNPQPRPRIQRPTNPQRTPRYKGTQRQNKQAPSRQRRRR